MDQTLITGKDAPLEETIDRATSQLHHLGIEVKTSNWLNPAPHCWSVHIECSSCPALYTNGKGTSREASLASGLGEFFERLSTDFFFAEYSLQSDSEISKRLPFRFHPEEKWFTQANGDSAFNTSNKIAQILTPQLQSFYDPDGELSFTNLLDNNLDDNKRGIATLPFKSVDTEEIVYFPVSLLNNLYVSNGMAAGNSPAECNSQALSEIIERFVKFKILQESIALPDIPRSALNRFPHLCAIIDCLQTDSFIIRLKDASLGGQFPVICALLIDTTSGGIFASFGCNCRFETALERTLTELLQGRQLDQLRNFAPPTHDTSLVADPFNLESHFIDSDGMISWRILREQPDYNFTPWDFKGTTTEELNLLTNIVKKSGHNIYRAEYKHCGIYCCRLLVPGLSEIYPVDDLIWNNRNRGTDLRPQLLTLKEMNPSELEAFSDRLETLELSDELLVSHVVGIIFDSSSSWSTLRIGELKALIALALQWTSESMQWCLWCIEYGELPRKRKKFFRLLHTLLGFKTNNEDSTYYSQTLYNLYSESEIDLATMVINGEQTFPGLEFGRRWEDISESHKKLLDIYDTVNRAKEMKQKT